MSDESKHFEDRLCRIESGLRNEQIGSYAAVQAIDGLRDRIDALEAKLASKPSDNLSVLKDVPDSIPRYWSPLFDPRNGRNAGHERWFARKGRRLEMMNRFHMPPSLRI